MPLSIRVHSRQRRSRQRITQSLSQLVLWKNNIFFISWYCGKKKQIADNNKRHRGGLNVVDSRAAVQGNSPRIFKCIFIPRENRMALLSTEELGSISNNTSRSRGITFRGNCQSCEAHFSRVDSLNRFTHIFTFNVKNYAMPVAILSAKPRIVKDAYMKDHIFELRGAITLKMKLIWELFILFKLEPWLDSQVPSVCPTLEWSSSELSSYIPYTWRFFFLVLRWNLALILFRIIAMDTSLCSSMSQN